MTTHSSLDAKPSLLSRRSLLKVGAGVLALSAAPSTLFAAVSDTRPIVSRSDLFAFRARGDNTIVLAAVFKKRGPSHDEALPYQVNFHISDRNWTLHPTLFPASGYLQSGRVQAYLGEIDNPEDQLEPITAAVLELPLDHVSAEKDLGVWAEIISGSGRHRVGSPLAASLLQADPDLARSFHSESPSADVNKFSQSFTDRIAALGRDSGVRDPGHHGSRICALTLPDVMTISPQEPIGFSFAARNGRHPSDDVFAVSSALLTGRVGAQSQFQPYVLDSEFPYFAGNSRSA